MTCSVWLARPPASDDHLVDLLDPIERQRRDGLRESADRRRFTSAAALLRLVLGDRAGLDPRRVTLDRTCAECGRPHGRPRAIGDVFDGVDVSVTHAGGHVAVALVEGARVGVDLEAVPTEFADLVDVACHTTERAAITTARAFATVWTRKEAVLKAEGSGLRVPPSGVVVSAPDRPAALVSWNSTSHAPGRVGLWDVPVDADHVGAVAVLDLRLDTAPEPVHGEAPVITDATAMLV